ncbi:MAG: alpha-L-fucosidase, partial [Thermoguttaceae bacterium]
MTTRKFLPKVLLLSLLSLVGFWLMPHVLLSGEVAPKLPTPTSSQVEWQDAGIGIFVHWAPNVYQGGQNDKLSTPREKINPDRFDADRIVQAAKSANAEYLIFVAKHVGGYCAWQTDTSDYSLKSSPWKNGQGDMVGDLAKACRKQGLGFGVYLSPRSDFRHVRVGGHAANAEKQREYNAVYRRQLTEILTHYGPLFELWFDGGNIVPVNDLIDRLAPKIITFQGRRTNSTRWVGNETGFAPYPCWDTIDWKQGEIPKPGAGTPTGNIWCPAECDVSILRPAWFWYKGCDRKILSLEKLLEIYYMSVGRGVNLLLNITPDDHGAIPDAQVRRLKEFGDEINARFAKPLGAANGEGNQLTLDLGRDEVIDHVVLREDIRGGERVRKFLVEGRRAKGEWTPLAQGTQVGNRQIIPFGAITVSQVRLTVRESVAPVRIRDLSVFHVNRPVPKLAYRKGNRQAMRKPAVSCSPDGIYAIDCPTPQWEIRYTLDGSEPTRQSVLYREPQHFPPGSVLKARYFDIGQPASPGGPVVTQPVPASTSRVADQTNTAVIPLPKIEENGYDWFKRHRQALELKSKINPQVVLIGDSITHMWAGEPKTRPDLVRGPISWKRLFGARPALNLGFGWDRTQNVLWRLDHGELDGLHPKFVVINIGTNNTSETDRARQNTPAEIVEAIQQIILRVRAKVPKARIVLMAIFPREEKPDHWRRKEINEINRRLASKFAHAPDITWLDIGPKLVQPDGVISRKILSDFCHPTERGYQIWADALLPVFQDASQSTDAQAATPVSWPGEKMDTWHGYKRHLFTVDGCPAWVVEPKQPAVGNPWTWCMEFPDAFTERTAVLQLLEKGFYYLHIKVGNTYGCPAALKHFDAFYQAVTARGLAKKGTLIGISRGGLYAYNWAARNPDKIVCIYGDAPVCDFKSWPGGKGKSACRTADWAALIKDYGFKDEAEAMAYKHNPVDELAPLAKAHIPLLHVVGDADDVVPVAENTRIMEE